MDKIKIEEIRNYLGTQIEVINNNGFKSVLSVFNIAEIIEYKHKPIVRPLSQLTEEIEHNGEKFVPLDWIWNNCQFLHDNVDYKELLVDTNNLENIIEWLPIKALNFLCECHFDVFGWIEKDLAIEKI